VNFGKWLKVGYVDKLTGLAPSVEEKKRMSTKQNQRKFNFFWS